METVFTKQIIRLLETIESRGYSNVFGDWVDLMMAALIKNEAAYMSITNRYRNDSPEGSREADLFAKAFGVLLLATQDLQHDAIGQVYEQFAAQSRSRRQKLGQFFTPRHVTDMVAKMTISEGCKDKQILDPCSGSGRFLISAARISPYNTFVGQDLDPICTKMTALNLLLFNVDGYALEGNSLLCSIETGYQTKRSIIGGRIRELTPVECEEIERRMKGSFEGKGVTEESSSVPVTINREIKQLSLFEM